MQGSVDLTAKDQRQPLSGTVLTLRSDWRVFSTFCLVSRNKTDKGLQEKKKRRAPYPSCSGLFQVLYKGHRMVLHLPQEKEKERIVLPKLLNERSSSSDRYQALLFCLPARLSCGCPAWIRQLCSFPPAQVHTHSLSLLRKFSPHLRAQHSNNSAPYPAQLCSLPAHPESHCAPTSILPFPFLLLLPWAALQYTDCSLLLLWPSKCSGAVNK